MNYGMHYPFFGITPFAVEGFGLSAGDEEKLADWAVGVVSRGRVRRLPKPFDFVEVRKLPLLPGLHFSVSPDSPRRGDQIPQVSAIMPSIGGKVHGGHLKPPELI
jgi:hypothetical protein